MIKRQVIAKKLVGLILALALTCAVQELWAEDIQPMVFIPAGKFIMGTNAPKADSNEKPAHEVFVDAFEIDRTEVKVADYKKCIAANVCEKITSSDPDLITDEKYFSLFEDDEPIREISWVTADHYCRWLGKRLPTEAEWEKTARGPKEYVNPWGNRPVKKGNAAIGVLNVYHVGIFNNDKSGYGVFDMAGNVMEWVADWYASKYYRTSPQNDPTGPQEGSMKVVRGGSWQTNVKGDSQRSFFSLTRFGNPPDTLSDVIGFRCAKSTIKDR